MRAPTRNASEEIQKVAQNSAGKDHANSLRGIWIYVKNADNCIQRLARILKLFLQLAESVFSFLGANKRLNNKFFYKRGFKRSYIAFGYHLIHYKFSVACVSETSDTLSNGTSPTRALSFQHP